MVAQRYAEEHIIGGLIGRLAIVWFVTLLPTAMLRADESCYPEAVVPAKQVYWGDLHVHTAFSMDAYVFGNVSTPRDAYAYARGEAVNLADGDQTTLARPLDFAAVTDHGEYFGLMNVCGQRDTDLEYCRQLAEAAGEGSFRGFREFFLPTLLAGDRNCQVDAAACAEAERDLWQQTIAAADEANEPCQFTAFVASEWSKSPNNHHWHRNLIYRSNVVPPAVINSFDQPTQEALWAALDTQCAQVEGCDVLAIPHNSNLGMGGAFRLSPEDDASLGLRARFERLLEVHQSKGSSECYPGSNFSDEACDFEIMLPVPLHQALQAEPREITPTEHAEISRGYARDVLARGLRVESVRGQNPFAYGLIGSTDSHSARPGDVEEGDWLGNLGTTDEQRSDVRNPIYNPGGLVAVWAEQNTREAIFDALQRRETYATSGPRIRLRFDQTFGTYASCERTMGEVTPMGSVVGGNPGRPPVFLVRALQDRAPLQRIDIVKLYLRDGELAQSIVSFTGNRQGRSDWCVAWTDDDYRADEHALWYARVLEVGTKRWDGTTVRERAWSSPIWSSP